MATARDRNTATEWGNWFHEGNIVATHARLGNSWWAWLWWMFVLEGAADKIWNQSGYTKMNSKTIMMDASLSVHAMLVGYAIECGLKGVWVARGNPLVRDGRYAGLTGAADHDLVALARTVGFATNTRETAVLRRLTKFIRFAGRYPVAKKPDEMVPDEHPTIGKIDTGFFSPSEFWTAASILNKLRVAISGKKRGFPRRRRPALVRPRR